MFVSFSGRRRADPVPFGTGGALRRRRNCLSQPMSVRVEAGELLRRGKASRIHNRASGVSSK